jgi:hypothetical protein
MPRNPDVLADCEALDELVTIRVPVTEKRRRRPAKEAAQSPRSKAEKPLLSTLLVTSPKTITYSAAFLFLAFLLGIIIS